MVSYDSLDPISIVGESSKDFTLTIVILKLMENVHFFSLGFGVGNLLP